MMEDNPRLGEALKRLAANGDFTLALTELKKIYTDQLVSTAPDEQTIREECYTKIMCYDDLQTWVSNYG